MRKTLITLALVVTPAVAGAQAANANAAAHAHANAKADTPGLAAEAHARIEARIAAAAERGVPAEPMRKRAAEGEAKQVGEAKIMRALARVEANMQASRRALVQAGRTPSDAEIAAGGDAVAEGATEAHIAGIARKAPSERSLVVALTTLASLTARGDGVANAVSRIEAQLARRASDAEISAGVSGAAHAGVNGAVHAGARGGNSAVSGNATAAAAVGAAGAGAAGGVAGSVTPAVGVGRRP